jgi:hypothetical protein
MQSAKHSSFFFVLLSLCAAALMGNARAPAQVHPGTCRNNGPLVDVISDTRAQCLTLVNTTPNPLNHPALAISGKFYDNQDSAFSSLMLFDPITGDAKLRWFKWVDETDCWPTQGYTSQSFPAEANSDPAVKCVVRAGNFTGGSPHGDEIFVYRGGSSPRAGFYQNTVVPPGNPSFTPVSLPSGLPPDGGWTDVVAGHFIAGNTTSLFFFKAGSSNRGVFAKFNASNSYGIQQAGPVLTASPTGTEAPFPGRTDNYTTPPDSCETLDTRDATPHWTHVVAGHFWADSTLDDLLFYDSNTGIWAVMQVQGGANAGKLFRVLASRSNTAIGTCAYPYAFEPGYDGILKGHFGVGGEDDICMTASNSAAASPNNKVFFAHLSTNGLFYAGVYEGESPTFPHTFTAITAGEFCVTNPDGDTPSTSGWLHTKPDDLKFGDHGFTDLVCFDPTAGADSAYGRINFWRFRQGDAWVRGRVEGYARPAPIAPATYSEGDSVAPGQELEFHLSSNAASDAHGNVVPDIVKITVVRKGDPDVPMPGELYALVDQQPIDHPDDVYSRGCEWPVSAKLQIPADWKSGLYVATAASGATTEPGTCNCHCQTEIPFVVRPGRWGDGSNILVVLATNTYNAYNWWGGRSLYGRGIGARETTANGHSRGVWYEGDANHDGANAGFISSLYDYPVGFKVTMDRPQQSLSDFPNLLPSYWQPPAAGYPNGYADENVAERPYLQYWEVPFVKWLDRHGITANFCTSYDLHKNAAGPDGLPMLDPVNHYYLVVFVGHDEYWTATMKHNVEDFVGAGGNAAFFSGNTCWWQVDYEDHGRRMVCYKNSVWNATETQWSSYGIGYMAHRPGQIPPDDTDPETNLTGTTWCNGVSGWPFWENTSGGNHLQTYTLTEPTSDTGYHWIIEKRDGTHSSVVGNGATFGSYIDPTVSGNIARSVIGWECDAVAKYYPPTFGGVAITPTVLAQVVYSDNVREQLDCCHLTMLTYDNTACNSVSCTGSGSGWIRDPNIAPVADPNPPQLATMAVFTRRDAHGNTYLHDPAGGRVQGTTFNAATCDWVLGLASSASVPEGPVDWITLNVLLNLGYEPLCGIGPLRAYVSGMAPTPVTIGSNFSINIIATDCPAGSNTHIAVHVNLSQVGGGTDVLLDHPGDSLYTKMITVLPAAAATYQIPYWVTSDQVPASSSLSPHGTFEIVAISTGTDLITGSDVVPTPTGTGYATGQGSMGLGMDSYRIFRLVVCDGSNFSASTPTETLAGITYNAFDTQLFLFDHQGNPLVCNDDAPLGAPLVGGTLQSYLSRLPDGSAIGAGVYYIGITAYNKDPMDASGNLLFDDTPLTGANGPSTQASGPLAGWEAGVIGSAGGNFRIHVTGLCATCCNADFNNDGDIATDADIEAFFACLAGSCCPSCGSTDFNCDGDYGTDADIEAFFRVLAGGSC